MKTIEVNTTSYKNANEEVTNGNAKIENWYVGNGQFGIEASKYNDFGEKAIKVKTIVSMMYPGTPEEWDKHIAGCIEDYVKNTEPTFENGWGEKSLKF